MGSSGGIDTRLSEVGNVYAGMIDGRAVEVLCDADGCWSVWSGGMLLGDVTRFPNADDIRALLRARSQDGTTEQSSRPREELNPPPPNLEGACMGDEDGECAPVGRGKIDCPDCVRIIQYAKSIPARLLRQV
jgi:hypothetical protein